MRTSQAALALIRRVNAVGENDLLTQWNNGWQAYSLIGGHVESGETFRQSCIREICEEIECEDSQFRVAKKPLVMPRFLEFSRSAHVETEYEWQLFDTELDGVVLDNLPPTCMWVSAQEIHDGETEDGEPISSQVRRVLTFLQGRRAMENEAVKVNWLADAKRDLDQVLIDQASRELIHVFASKHPKVILVTQRFSGFSDEPYEKLIIAVEVQYSESSSAHVVKLVTTEGSGNNDCRGWDQCAVRRGVASRLFMPPVAGPISDTRQAVIYSDVYQYYYDDGISSQPRELEHLVQQSIQFNHPSTSSIERVLTQIYTEAHRCFYLSAKEDSSRQVAVQAVVLSLQLDREFTVLDRWELPEYQELRRDAAWVTCGNRTPGSLERPAYIDPVDYLRWVLGQPFGLSGRKKVLSLDQLLERAGPFLKERLPAMLIGPAHGDLHGRNIIVGSVRGEAEWPAVIDFDKMSDLNLIAWDFAKLEMELKCRLLPELIDTEEERVEVRRLLGLGPDKRPVPKEVRLNADELRAGQRAELLEIMFAVERLLDNWTRQITGSSRAKKSDAADLPSISLETPLGRALRILLRIRKEAAIYLGFERGRGNRWLDGYYFALAAYGVITAKWHDGPNDHLSWSLLSAGVACAGLRQFPWPPNPTVVPDAATVASYLHLLPYAQGCWNDQRPLEPIELLRQGVERFPYAVALRQQLALSMASSESVDDRNAVRRQIESIAKLACVFHDHETLCRLGRIHKDRADGQYDGKYTHAELLETAGPAYQDYLAALKYYQQAYQVSGHYYPGINAATMALMAGEKEVQYRMAEEVIAICNKLSLDRDDHLWILATEGEAFLLRERPDRSEQAVRFYHTAIQFAMENDKGAIDSMWKQLCRLHWVLGDAILRPVRELFISVSPSVKLSTGPFGNCGLS